MFQSRIEVCLSFGWRYIADGFEEAPVIKPVDPFERGELQGFDVSPRPVPVVYLSFV